VNRIVYCDHFQGNLALYLTGLFHVMDQIARFPLFFCTTPQIYLPNCHPSSMQYQYLKVLKKPRSQNPTLQKTQIFLPKTTNNYLVQWSRLISKTALWILGIYYFYLRSYWTDRALIFKLLSTHRYLKSWKYRLNRHDNFWDITT